MANLLFLGLFRLCCFAKPKKKYLVFLGKNRGISRFSHHVSWLNDANISLLSSMALPNSNSVATDLNSAVLGKNTAKVPSYFLNKSSIVRFFSLIGCE